MMMIIQHNGKIVQSFDSTDPSEVVQRINTSIHYIQENEQVVTEIFIDGQDVTGAIEHYISENVTRLGTIDIRSIHTNEMFKLLLQDTYEYVKKVYKATDSISDLFYGNPDRDAWTYFSQLTVGLQYTAQSVQMLITHLEREENDEEILTSLRAFLQKLQELLGELHQAVESQDHVFIADIVKYEIGDSIKQLLIALESKVNI